MSESLEASWRRAKAVPRANLLLLAGLGGVICLLLWQEWLHDPDLSHGFFMPAIFVFLLWEARRGPPRPLSGSLWPLIFTVAVVGVACVAASGLYAAALGWTSSLVSFTMTTGYAILCLATVASLSVVGVEMIPFTWPAVTACLLWILASPIPPGTYTRLSLHLQLAISSGVLHLLHLLGIPAHRQGNIIELSHASVGIEDACSGVRSLISCLYAGLFLSAVLPLRRSSRLLLIALSVPLALGMNFLRSMILTLLVNRGVRIEGLWHDMTGYSVLGATAAILAALAYLAAQRRPTPPPVARSHPAPSPIPGISVLVCLLAVAFLGTISLLNTQPHQKHGVPPPNLQALLPDHADGWRVVTRSDLYQFEGTLRTDHLAERTYVRSLPDGRLQQVTLYLAYWQAGQAPVSLVAMHTPDACWPGTGWDLQPQAETQQAPVISGRRLPTAEYRLFVNQGFPQYVWFWHLYDGSPISFQDPHSAVTLLRIAYTYGFRHDGDQLFVRVAANEPWRAIQSEPFLIDFLARVHALGL